MKSTYCDPRALRFSGLGQAGAVPTADHVEPLKFHVAELVAGFVLVPVLVVSVGLVGEELPPQPQAPRHTADHTIIAGTDLICRAPDP
jgi:hypothetical protein